MLADEHVLACGEHGDSLKAGQDIRLGILLEKVGKTQKHLWGENTNTPRVIGPHDLPLNMEGFWDLMALGFGSTQGSLTSEAYFYIGQLKSVFLLMKGI